MANMVMGVFSTRDSVDEALYELEQKGYNPKDISVVTKEVVSHADGVDTGLNVAGGAVSGATTGAVIGGLAGLLIGIGAIAIPGIGGILVGGPLAAAMGLTGAAATTVSGATTGALAGGIVGALTGLGVPEDVAHEYEEEIKRGGTLIAVPAREGTEDEASDILTTQGAQSVRMVPIKF